MSGSPYPPPTYPPHHPLHGRPYITVHDHDILCGRGVNIASHPGNERFRALVQTRHDNNYCTLYTTSEKRAVAEEILRHIKALDPPGRFLKRVGRAPTSRGLQGPWEELSDRESIKKTCQALRDCNRTDRTGYAAAVSMPDDVRQHAQSREATGLSNKQQAAMAAAVKRGLEGTPSNATAGAAIPAPSPHSNTSGMAPGLMPLHPYPPRAASGAPMPVPMPLSMGMHLALRPAPGAPNNQGYPVAPPAQGMPLPPPPPQPSVHNLYHQLPLAPPSAAAHASHPSHLHPLHYHNHHQPPSAAYYLPPGVHFQYPAAAAAAAAYQSHQQLQQQHQPPQEHQKSHTPTGQRKAPPASRGLVEIAPAQSPVAAAPSGESTQPQVQQQHVQHLHPTSSQPQIVPPEGSSLKRDRSSYEGDRTISPSVQRGAEWLKKQKGQPAAASAAIGTAAPRTTVPVPAPVPPMRRMSAPQPIDTRFLLPTPTGNTITPSSTSGSIPGYLSLASYDMGVPARTPSQETSTTRGDTPTTEGTDGSRAHRPSLSPASGMSAMPPSPSLAYDPHRAGAVDPTLYSHDDYGRTPPTPTESDPHPFSYHQIYQGHTEAPGAEPKHPYSTEATLLEQQQLQEAAAYVNDTSDGHLGADYANESPNSYHDDSLHNSFD